MTLDELRAAVAAGTVDTVLLGFCDMQGRLQGKRLVADHFLDDVVEHGAEGCNYLLAVDVDMNTVDGYAMSSWSTGYGDFALKPDLATLRLVPWHEGTAMCMADIAWHDDSDVVASPRQILRRQLARLSERGWTALAATELEFIVFRDTYEAAWRKAYRDLEPANYYNVDYSMLGTSRVEPLIGRIRREMARRACASRTPRASATSASTRSTSPTRTRSAPPTRTRSTRTPRRRSPARRAWRSPTWPSTTSARATRATSTSRCASRTAGSCSATSRSCSTASSPGQLACLRDLTLFLAPNVNSYKRYAEGSFAPTAVAWGKDNRTCSLRVVGHGPGLRVENRVPGGDVNPYLALAAMIASGLHGIDDELELEPAFEGNAYTADKPRVPDTLRDARELFAAATWRARRSARTSSRTTSTTPTSSCARSKSAVTDWERFRGFERL